jgi:hypothetical protein
VFHVAGVGSARPPALGDQQPVRVGTFQRPQQIGGAAFFDARPLPRLRSTSGVTPRQSVAAFRAGFPDALFTVEDVIGEGDRVAVRYKG